MSNIEEKFRKEKNNTLMMSLIIDSIGLLSYVMPGFAIIFDVIWAPISGLLIFSLYKKPSIAIAGFVEEILPLTDFIPIATIAWLNKYVKKGELTFEEFVKSEKRKRDIIEQNS